jgi:hypothetical protein
MKSQLNTAYMAALSPPSEGGSYPYEVDKSLAGVKVKIMGERAVYSISAHEWNPRNDKHWLVLVNKEGWRHVTPDRVRRVKNGRGN